MASESIIIELILRGAQQFQAQARAAAGSLGKIGSESKSAGGPMGKMGGVLGSVGSKVKILAGAAGFAGVGATLGFAAKKGVDFNANMEQSQVAFTNLLGSSSDAQAMLDRLYQVAAKTPFEFPQLVQSTQRLLGFGMAAKDVEPTMMAVGDAVAAAGGGAEQIDRVSTALGQMQAKGKVSSEELLQLAESGVPALKILQDQLGLTGAQLTEKLQKGAISADQGIGALVAGIEKRYGGMAEAQSKTFAGQMSSIQDNVNQLLGKATGPLFQVLAKSVLPAVGQFVSALSGQGRSPFLDHIKSVIAAMAPLWAAFRSYVNSVVWAFKPLLQYVKYLVPVLRILGIVIGAILVIELRLMAAQMRVLGRVIRIVIGVVKALVSAIRGIVGAISSAISWVRRLNSAINNAMSAAARAAVNRAKSIARGFVNLGREIIRSVVEGIKSAPGAILDAIMGLVPGPLKGPLGKLVGRQHGGIVGPNERVTVVGERGPELATFRPGTRVTPLRGAPVSPLQPTPAGHAQTTAQFFLDRRLIMTAVAQATADQAARR